MEDLRAPFPWFGGKSRAAHIIWPRLGDCKNYVEPFFGSGAVLLNRPGGAGQIETVNDLDCYVANFWRSLAADPQGVAHHAVSPLNEADLHARHKWLVQQSQFRERMLSDPDYHDTKIAGWWVWGIGLWIGSGWCRDTSRKIPILTHGSTWRTTRSLPHLNHGRGIHRSAVDVDQWFGDLSERLSRVRVACGNWDRILSPAVTTSIGVTGVLLDPPYTGTEGIYATSSTVAKDVMDWAEANGDNPKFRIALCGLEGDYQMPPAWTCIPWKAQGGFSHGKTAHLERIWFSPHCLDPVSESFKSKQTSVWDCFPGSPP